MGNEYFLQEEFKIKLKDTSISNDFTPSFYNNQICKLNKLEIFKDEGECFTNVLKNEILSHDFKSIGDQFYSVFNTLEYNFLSGMKIHKEELNALRLGLLKYKKFVYEHIGVKENIKTSDEDFSQKEKVTLRSFFKGVIKYKIPLYHDNYAYNEDTINHLWKSLLKVFKDDTINNKPLFSNRTPIELTCIEKLVVKKGMNGNFEVVHGGNTLITLNLFYQVLSMFSGNEELRYGRNPLLINTVLNEQKLYCELLRNRINKNAIIPEDIVDKNTYNFEEIRFNTGFAFYETLFHFTKLFQTSKIPQSENYISNIKLFERKILNAIAIERNCLINEDSIMPFYNDKEALSDVVLNWL